jgi:hypothetical protein
VPCHVTKQGSIRTILHSIKMITPFTDLLQCNFQHQITLSPFTNVLVTVALLATHLPAPHRIRRDITMFRGALHVFLSGTKEAKSTSPNLFI